jgi:hypothetical protein
MNEATIHESPVIGVYEARSQAEAAIKALARGGLDMSKVSIVGKGVQGGDEAHGFYTVGDRVRAWGASGGFWGAAWGLLLGSAVFVMPPFGLVAAAGPITAVLVAAFEGIAVVGGMSALSAALAKAGVPHEQAVRHEADLLAGHLLLIVHGSAADADRARAILTEQAAPHPLPIHQAA